MAELGFSPTDQLPIKALGMFSMFGPHLSREQQAMKAAFGRLPPKWQQIVMRDAQRSGVVTGMDLINAMRNAAMEGQAGTPGK